MAFNVALATLLCLTTWISSVHIIRGQEYSCCLKNRNTRIRQEKIASYRLQIQGLCPITSVKFFTYDNKTICWDPNAQYAQRAIKRINQSKAAAEKKEVMTTPVSNATNKTTATSLITAPQLSYSTQIQSGNTGDMTARTMPVESKKPPRRRGKKSLRRRKDRKTLNQKSS